MNPKIVASIDIINDKVESNRIFDIIELNNKYLESEKYIIITATKEMIKG